MEEITPTRRSSGIADTPHASNQSLASGASLRGASSPFSLSSRSNSLQEHAAPIAGSRFSEGQNVSSPAPPAGLPRDASTSQPFYKKPWFIISQIVMIPIGIALLFILLFPVVRAVVQLIVNKSTLVGCAAGDHITTQEQQASACLVISEVKKCNLFRSQFCVAFARECMRLPLFLWDSDLDSHQVVHTGAVSALIEFTEPVNVSWVVDANTQVRIGSMKLSGLSAKHGRALVDQNTTFIINDEAALVNSRAISSRPRTSHGACKVQTYASTP